MAARGGHAARRVSRAGRDRPGPGRFPRARGGAAPPPSGQRGPLSQRIALLSVEQISCLRRSEEHTSELQSLMRISYAVFCLKKITILDHIYYNTTHKSHTVTTTTQRKL